MNKKKKRKCITGNVTGIEYPSSIYHAISRGKTSFEQFCLSVFWSPLGTELYFHYVKHSWLRISCFCLNIWCAEIIGGVYLTYIWKKRAWQYNRFSYFDGNITLLYAPVWIFLGFIHEYMYYNFYLPVSTYICMALLFVYS